MAKIQLTMLQRLSLDALLGVQRGGLDDLFTLPDTGKKIKAPKAQKDESLKALPDGRFLIDEQAVELAEPAEYDLEKEEIRRLQRLLREWPQFTESDLAWLVPLKKQLDGTESVARKG